MKNNLKTQKFGGGYSTPTLETLTVNVEQGFAGTTKPDYGGEGDPGTDPSDPGFGDF